MRRGFGQITRQRSGRYQARWRFDGAYYTARRESDGGPLTFSTKRQAENYLEWVQREIEAGRWAPPTRTRPSASAPALRAYASRWLGERRVRGRALAETTRDHYEQLLDDHIYPAFGDRVLTSITYDEVKDWYYDLAGGRLKTKPTALAHAYDLLKSILKTGVDEEILTINPCRIRGAGQARRVSKTEPATLAELEIIVQAVPAKYRLMVMFAAWCQLRFGELAEIRRHDVDGKNAVVWVRRGVVRTKRQGRLVKDPKSDAGKRPVSIPPHLMPMVADHLKEHAQPGRDGLIFPAARGGHLAPSTLYRVYYPARAAAGRADLRFHDLRHTGATLSATTGATLKELMARLGHSTPAAAIRYQHATRERDRILAAKLSDLATSHSENGKEDTG